MGKDKIEAAKNGTAITQFPSRLARFSSSESHGADLGSLEEVPDLGRAIDRITRAGDALLIGITRDGSAHLVRLYSGGSSEDVYCGSQAKLDRTIEALLEVYDGGE